MAVTTSGCISMAEIEDTATEAAVMVVAGAAKSLTATMTVAMATVKTTKAAAKVAERWTVCRERTNGGMVKAWEGIMLLRYQVQQ
jgi:hypothetical protein